MKIFTTEVTKEHEGNQIQVTPQRPQGAQRQPQRKIDLEESFLVCRWKICEKEDDYAVPAIQKNAKETKLKSKPSAFSLRNSANLCVLCGES